MLKKMLCLLAALCLLPVFALADPTAEPESEGIAPLIEADFLFTFEDAEYALGGEVAPLIAAVEQKYGAAMELVEAESCMFTGKDREYSNADLVIGTYPAGKDGADVIETIMALSETFMTARGACVGMTLDEVAELYGDNFTLDYDQMIYQMGENGPMLVFNIDLESDEVVCWSLLKNTTK